MRRTAIIAMALALAGPAAGQGLPTIPGLGQSQPETPEQKRAFCGRVAAAALRCGPGFDVVALSSCLVRTLPAQDSLRVAQVANNARGNAGALLSDCGVGLGR
ncbi:hypothetical protein [Falsiroseomonas sp. HW251]|uniref:hypothetical protein n=1 Tax=Falsiroseomonas sp. HW251 TaxID=3390998 RepID=UPI003D32263A